MAVNVWKLMKNETPGPIYSRLRLSNTRSRVHGTLAIPVFESALARKSFLVRSAAIWNSIPGDIRDVETLQNFKKKLKKWIQTNIELE